MLVLLADGVFLVHGVFVILVLPSAVLAFMGYYRSKRHLWRIHNLSIGAMVLGRVSLGQCPLVVLEEMIRNAAGDKMPYSDSYVGYVVRSLTGVTPPDGSVMMISAIVALVSLLAVLRHRPSAAKCSPVTEQAAVG